MREEDVQAFELALCNERPLSVALCRLDLTNDTRVFDMLTRTTTLAKIMFESSEIHSTALINLVRACPNLKALSLLSNAFGDELLYRLAGLLACRPYGGHLQELQLAALTFGDVAMRKFTRMSPKFSLRSLTLLSCHFRHGASEHLAPLVLLCTALRDLRVVSCNLLESNVSNVLHAVSLRRDFESISLARKAVVDGEIKEVLDLNRAEYLDFLTRCSRYGASLTRLDLLGQGWTVVAQRKIVRRLRENVSLLSLGNPRLSSWAIGEIMQVQRILQRNSAIVWSKVHPALVDFALAIAPLELPLYIALHIFDFWFEGGSRVSEYLKVQVLSGVLSSRRRLKGRE
jgi:hypothetical protein